MGTSSSHRSPSTANWNAVAAGYMHESIPVERLTQELWRAATNQPLGDLTEDLSAPIISACLQIALDSDEPTAAVMEARNAIAHSGEVTIATDFAQRAIVQSLRADEERTLAFVQALISEASNYLVSRDLSGYLGLGQRINNISDSIDLKISIQESMKKLVGKIPIPKDLVKTPDNWKIFINRVINEIAGREL